MTLTPVPKGLTAGSAGIWKELTTLHRFEAHELVAFERALRWWDQSDAWLKDSAAVEGRDRGQLIKQALDGASAALRLWRTLRFTNGEAARRPGRPPGDDWSAQRRAQKLQKVV